MNPVPPWTGGEAFYRHVEEGYDGLAPTYDDDVGTNEIGIRMRRIFRDTLVKYFHSGRYFFEVGCGTGIDSLWLARNGMEVVATDISQGMLDRLTEKARREGLSERITCRRLAARQVGALADEFGEEVFDGGFCHAGALNMEPDLKSVPNQIRRLLKLNAVFVCSVINVVSLFEVIFYPLVFKPRKAFRRLGNVIPVPLSRTKPFNRYVVPARFYSPKMLFRVFSRGFVPQSVRGIQILLPPSNLVDYYVKTRPAFRALETLEDWFSLRWPLNSLGHHTLIAFRKC